jgi:transcription elongation factor Elf1
VSRRTKPYTAIGVRRLRCVRCGAQAVHQWQVCADDNTYRPICLDCDIALNRLALEFVGDPDIDEKMARYELKARSEFAT